MNSICTSKGGKHVEYITDQIVNVLQKKAQKWYATNKTLKAKLEQATGLLKAREAARTCTKCAKGRFGSGTWRYQGTRPMETGVGLNMAIVGPNGWGIDLSLQAQADPGRPPVGVAYGLWEKTPAEEAKPILRELLVSLRG